MMLRNTHDLNSFLTEIVERIEAVSAMLDTPERENALMDNIIYLTTNLSQTQQMSELNPKNKFLKIALASIHYAIAGQILIRWNDQSAVIESSQYLEDKKSWEYCMQAAIKIATELKQADLKHIFKTSRAKNQDSWRMVVESYPSSAVQEQKTP